jgi:hypothetical protein
MFILSLVTKLPRVSVLSNLVGIEFHYSMDAMLSIIAKYDKKIRNLQNDKYIEYNVGTKTLPRDQREALSASNILERPYG